MKRKAGIPMSGHSSHASGLLCCLFMVLISFLAAGSGCAAEPEAGARVMKYGVFHMEKGIDTPVAVAVVNSRIAACYHVVGISGLNIPGYNWTEAKSDADGDFEFVYGVIGKTVLVTVHIEIDKNGELVLKDP